MSQAVDPTIRDLNNCECCDGLSSSTPVAIENRPGLSAIAYRVGTHGQFKQSMLASLSDARRAKLGALNTREDDDFSIALLDGWAMVADVLGFYQERIANESYLRTATERRSLLEMARTIGYELRPGVAADTYLAFTLDATAFTPETARIDIGTKSQSIPGQDELPQTFETVEQIVARAEWNALRPRMSRPDPPSLGQQFLYLKGTETGLRAGDALLVIGDERKNEAGDERWDFRLAAEVTPVGSSDPEKSYTIVKLDRSLGSQYPRVEPATENPRVYALRQRAALFGHNAPEWRMMPTSLKNSYLGFDEDADPSVIHEWPGFTIADLSDPPIGTTEVVPSSRLIPREVYTIHLDASYPKIFANSWIVLSHAGYQEVYEVETVAGDARAAFALTAKTTRLTLKGEQLRELFNERLRDTAVFAQSEELEIAGEPISDDISGASIELDHLETELIEGQRVAVSGVDAEGIPQSEVVVIDRLLADAVTTLIFTTELQYSYRRDSVTINANVARATNGETKQEILGSGDGAQTFQRFTLKQNPLTYTSSDDPTGGASTLVLRVNGVEWKQVPTLYGRGPHEQIYILRLDDDANSTVIFGDGRTGARLPTGVENITAEYRTGIGKVGEVDTGQISLLMTRALGVKSVVNPVAATGAADAQSLSDSRRNAPLSVMTLGRIVSLLDYEDFARSFSGIGKALATWTWNRNTRGVLITVAGTDGESVADTLHENLLSAISKSADTYVPVQVKSYRPAFFSITGSVAIAPAYLVDDVMNSVEALLRARFSFEAREFGQPVHLSEVIAVIQSVPGVVFVDIDEIRRTDGMDSATPLISDAPGPGAISTIDPAELLMLVNTPLDQLQGATWASI